MLQRARAFRLLNQGETVPNVARAVGVCAGTVRRWRQRRGAARAPAKPATETGSTAEEIEAMLRAEAPAVMRMVLDQAKGGDLRAAGIVVKELANRLGSVEGSDVGKSAAALDEFEKQVGELPPAVAAEIVGLLEQAQRTAAGDGAEPDPPAARGERGHLRLPWQPEDRPPDEG